MIMEYLTSIIFTLLFGKVIAMELVDYRNFDSDDFVVYNFLQSALDIQSNLYITHYDNEYHNALYPSLGPFSNSSHGDPAPDIHKRCFAFLEEFGSHTADFIQCSIEFSRPFRFCEGCVIQYTKSMTAYDDIHQNDNSKGGCRDILLDADRVQVLNQIHDNLQSIWNTAYCDNCFEGTASEDNNGTVRFRLNSNIQLFLFQYSNVSQCILNNTGGNYTVKTGNSSVCVDCKGFYKTLNGHYKKLMDETDHQVCMDVVDMMNYTRLMWGDTLRCSKHNRDDPYIVFIAFILGCMPLLFYLSARFLAGHKVTTLLRQKRMRLGSVQSNDSNPRRPLILNEAVSGSYQSLGNRLQPPDS